jgi:hypothetical protein
MTAMKAVSIMLIIVGVISLNVSSQREKRDRSQTASIERVDEDNR